MTDKQPRIDWVDASFNQARLALARYEVRRPIATFRHSLMLQSAQFIQVNQNSDGSWGAHALFETNLALRALGLWRQHLVDLKADNWTTHDGLPGGVELAFHWLASIQDVDNWEGNIWDTAGVIRAAALHQRLNEPAIRRGLAWLGRQRSTTWGLSVSLPPHYAAQAYLAFRDARVSDQYPDLLAALYRVADAQPDLPRRSLYVGAQLVEALIAGGCSPTDVTVERLVTNVQECLTDLEVSSANFLDIAAGFIAGASVQGAVDERAEWVRTTLERLLNPSRIRPDGSWYRDVLFTSWALVAMSPMATIVTFEALPGDINVVLEEMRADLRSGADARIVNSRRTFAGALLAGVAGTTLLWITIVYLVGPVSVSASSFVWWVSGLLLTMVVGSVRFALRRSKPRSRFPGHDASTP